MSNQILPKPQEGTWVLVAPDGRDWTGPSPLKCVQAEMNDRIPPVEQLQRITAAVNEPDFADRHLQLAGFYSASNVDDLVDKMEAHINKLQEKLAAHTPPFSFAPEQVRGG